MWNADDIVTFLKQSGMVDANGRTLDFEGIVRTALSMEVPLATVASALGWGADDLDRANSMVLFWDMQRDMQTYPAHQVREMWASQRGVAPSMFNRIYRMFTGTDVPEPVVVNYVPPTIAPPPPAVTFDSTGQPSLTGRALLRYDAAALGLSAEELLYRVYRSSIDKGVPLATIRQQIAQKYDVSEADLDAMLNARNPGIVDRYQNADEERAAHVAWQAQPVPMDPSVLKPPPVYVAPSPAVQPPIVRTALPAPAPGPDPDIPGGGGVVVATGEPGAPGAPGAAGAPSGGVPWWVLLGAVVLLGS